MMRTLRCLPAFAAGALLSARPASSCDLPPSAGESVESAAEAVEADAGGAPEGDPDDVGSILARRMAAGARIVERTPPPLSGKAVWAWSSTVAETGPAEAADLCRELDIRHVFLLVKGTGGRIQEDVLRAFLPLARAKGLYVHAWVICFNDRSMPDATPDSPAYRRRLLETIASFVTLEAGGEVVDGIHLDYIRYPGNTASKRRERTSSFVRSVRKLIDGLGPGTVLSIAGKAENYGSREGIRRSALAYGQDYGELAAPVDLFCPMTYHLDYAIRPEDAAKGAGWIRELTGKPVFAGIQLHPSEHPATRGKPPAAGDVARSLGACAEGRVDGAAFFSLKDLVGNREALSEVISGFGRPAGR